MGLYNNFVMLNYARKDLAVCFISPTVGANLPRALISSQARASLNGNKEFKVRTFLVLPPWTRANCEGGAESGTSLPRRASESEWVRVNRLVPLKLKFRGSLTLQGSVHARARTEEI